MCETNVVSGETYAAEMDFRLAGHLPLLFIRTYRSFNRTNGVLGRGWSTLLDTRIDGTDGCRMYLFNPGGERIELERVPGGYARAGGRIRVEILDSARLLVREGPEHKFELQAMPGSSCYQISRFADAKGNHVLLHRDGWGVVREIEDSCGRRLWLQYSPNGYLRQIGLGKEILAQYWTDSMGDLIEAWSLPQRRFQYRYSDHLMVCAVNPSGGSRLLEYDDRRRCIHVWRGDGTHLKTIARSPDGKYVRHLNSRGALTLYFLDPQGRIESQMAAGGKENSYYYGSTGGPVASSGTQGPILRIIEESGKKITVIRDGLVAITTFDSAGLPVRSEYLGSWIRTREFADGRLQREVDCAGGEWSYAYDEYGDLCETRGPLGFLARRSIDRAYKKEILEDGMGLIAEYSYDDLGRVIALREGNGAVSRVEYLEGGRVFRIISPSGITYDIHYDNAGHIRQFLEAGRSTVEFKRNEYGQVLSIVRADNAHYVFTYDSEGSLTSLLTPGGAWAKYQIRFDGRLASLAYSDGREYQISYDLRRRVKSISNGQDSPFYQVEYGADDLPVLAKYQDGTFCRVTYGEEGRIAALENEAGVLKYEFDARRQLTAEIFSGQRIGYEYDGLGRVTAISGPHGVRLEFEWDARSRPVALKLNGAVYRYEYDACDLISRALLPGGWRQEFTYDPDEQLVKQLLYHGDTLAGGESYLYDEFGNLRRIESRNSARIREIEVDVLGRPVRVKGHGRSESYYYDLDDNIQNRADGSPLRYRNSAFLEGPEYKYSREGCLVYRRVDGREWHYEYNLTGQLKRAAGPWGSIEYEYDAMGRMCRRTANGVRTDYFWTGTALLGSVTQGRVVCYGYLPGTYLLAGISSCGQDYACLWDVSSSVRAMIDVAAGTVQPFERTTFGVLLDEAPRHLPVPGFVNQWWDKEAGLFYNLHRHYDAETGRFTSPDPLGYDGGPNLYLYSRNPWHSLDPLGLYTCTIKVSPCWNDCQVLEAKKKMRRLNYALRNTPKTPAPTPCGKAREAWTKCKGKMNQDIQNEESPSAHQCEEQHIDHIKEKQLGGTNACDNLQPLNARVNSSFGSQIKNCRTANAGLAPTAVLLDHSTRSGTCEGIDCSSHPCTPPSTADLKTMFSAVPF